MAVIRLVSCLTLMACVIGQDKYPRPRDLSPAWLVDRPRVLAIVAEPPEIAPGGTATFQGLIPIPEDEPAHAVLWFACEDNDFGYGCAFELPTTTGTGATTAVPDGLIGYEPFLAPSYTPPLDALEGLSASEALEGLYTLIEVIAAPEEALVEVTEDVDFSIFETAYKRLVVSTASTPNHNPGVAGFRVEDVPIAEQAVVHLDPNQPYELTLELSDGSIETYEYLNSVGDVEVRTEEPYVTWYTTGGELLEFYTLHPYLDAGFVSPAVSGTQGTWWAVVRDRRGGMAWKEVAWIVD